MEFVKTTVLVLQIDLSACTVSFFHDRCIVLLSSFSRLYTYHSLLKLAKSNYSVKGYIEEKRKRETRMERLKDGDLIYLALQQRC